MTFTTDVNIADSEIETNMPRKLLAQLNPNEEAVNFLRSLLELSSRSGQIKNAIEKIQDQDYGFFFSAKTATLLNQTTTIEDFDERLLTAITPYYMLATELLSSRGLPEQGRIESRLSTLAENSDLNTVGMFLREFGEQAELSDLRFPSFRNRVSNAKNDMIAVISEANDVLGEILAVDAGQDTASRRLCRRRPRLCEIITIIVIVIVVIL